VLPSETEMGAQSKRRTQISQIIPITPKTRRVVRTPSSFLVRDGFAFAEYGLGTQGLPEVGSLKIEPVFRDAAALGAANPAGLVWNRRNPRNLCPPLELRSHADSTGMFCFVQTRHRDPAAWQCAGRRHTLNTWLLVLSGRSPSSSCAAPRPRRHNPANPARRIAHPVDRRSDSSSTTRMWDPRCRSES